jgi:flagellar biogenesis protein FliO
MKRDHQPGKGLMAQWIGLIICLAAATALGSLAVDSRADELASPPARSGAASSASVAPRYPAGFGAKDEHVERAVYQNSTELRSSNDKGATAQANRGDSLSLAGQARDPGGDKSTAHAGHRELPPTPSSGPALFSMLGSLAIVLGLFFGLIWLMRRGMPKGTRLLSSEVVEVLGRAPLAGRQQMHVVRFGNKLLLISLSPGGAETLSEITEPAEVDRLSGICQQTHVNSATTAFRQVFRQFGDDRSFFRRSASKPGAEPLTRKTTVPSVMEDDDV